MADKSKDEPSAEPGDPAVVADTLPSEASGVRQRTPSVKGREYMMDMKAKMLKSLFCQLKRKFNQFEHLMAEGKDVSELRAIHQAWLSLYEEHLQLYSDFLEILGEEEDPFEDKNCLLRMFKKTMEQFFVSDTKAVGEQINSYDSASQVMGHTSSSSSVSRVTSMSSARVKEEQKLAELSSRLSSMKLKKEVELAKLNLKLKEEELKLQTEIGVANARAKVLDQLEQLSNVKSSKISSKQGKHNVIATGVKQETQSVDNVKVSRRNVNVNMNDANVQPLRPTAMPFVSHEHNPVNNDYFQQEPTNHFVPGALSQQDSEHAVWSVIRQLRKPAPDIKCFSGDPLEYRQFMRQFRSKITSNAENEDELLNYLEQFTIGEANKIVTGFTYLDSSVGFPAALKELDRRYGNEEVVANAFVKRALEWPAVKADTPKNLDEFAIFLEECSNAVQTIEAVQILQYPDNLRRLVSKLPFQYQEKWRSVVQNIKSKGHIVQFRHLADFVKMEASKACDPTYGRDALRVDQKATTTKGQTSHKRHSPKASFSTNASDEVAKAPVDVTSQIRTQHCIFCEKKSHSVDSCFTFGRKPYSDRISFLKVRGMCFGCTRPGHLSRDCHNRCVCSTCKGRHPTSLHDNSKVKQVQEEKTCSTHQTDKQVAPSTITTTSHDICSHTGASEGDCTMAVIPVSVGLNNGLQTVITYAFLDPGSNVSFVSDQLLHKLGGNGKRMSITIDTMGVTHKMDTRVVEGLHIGDLNCSAMIGLNRVYTKDKIPISKRHIPTIQDISKWPHLKDVRLPDVEADIGLLIGNNVPDAYTPLQVRTGPRGSPHATQSRLGWIVWNVVRDKETHNDILYSVNRAEVAAFSKAEDFQQLDKLVRDSINLDFPERITDDKPEHSQEDKCFLENVKSSIELQNGHYVISLPFKKETVYMPNNESQAIRRLASLKRKLIQNSQFGADYMDFMQQVLDKGYAEKVSSEDIQGQNGRVWYIPHHGIYHPRKPNKLRVVFDCAATYLGVSLNGVLLQGPDMTNNLFGVLLRFRQEPMAIIGDIETMFYQVKVPEYDRDFLRFLWWPEGDITTEPQIYRMTVHLFGAVSSPSCSSFALRRTADDNSDKFDDDIANGVRRNFYVDDYLNSTSTPQEAISLIKETSAMCQLGGFKLTKWVSNSHEVLQSVPKEHCSKEVKSLDLKHDRLPSDRALGVFWITESDELSFQVGERVVPCTRRGILSLTSSIYDPIGFLSPFILNAKRILQDLCRQEIGWDEEIEGSSLKTWTGWIEDLALLERMQIPRCYKPTDFGPVVSCELHNFADASNIGYGMVMYFRFTNDKGDVHCSFVLGKARVAPLKKITVPRMELTAATTLVRLNKMLLNELDYEINKSYFWTDSVSVLRYISNESSRFQTFVANRIAVIRDATEVNQWRYVGSEINPADLPSRGVSMEKLLHTQQWLNGPDFLWKPEEEWPKQIVSQISQNENDPEIKKSVNTVQCREEHPLEKFITYYSDWFRLCKAIGWLLRARRNLHELVSSRAKLKQTLVDQGMSEHDVEQRLKENRAESKRNRLSLSKEILTSSLSCKDVQHAKTLLVSFVQGENFETEIQMLQNGEHVKRSSSLYKLDPFILDGILRVGGRLHRSALPVTSKHPVVLPKTSPISKLILRDAHRSVGHLGNNAILAFTRRNYWIMGASSLVKNITATCSTCRRYQSRSQVQKMASLPPERLTSDEPPFSSVGMDYFGPFLVKRGRVNVKRYGVIFTCLTSRAVHLEVAATLDADSCINAMQGVVPSDSSDQITAQTLLPLNESCVRSLQS